MQLSNTLRNNRLTAPGRSATLVCLSLAWCGFLATPTQASGTSNDASADGAACQVPTSLASATDPCPLLEQAQAFVPRLTRSAAEYARKVGAGFDPERSLRIQEALLREDLVWLSRGFSRQQIDLMVFVSVALSLEQADELSRELQRSFAATGDPNDQLRIKRVDLYQSEALNLLEELSTSLRSMPESELKFHF